MSSNTVTTVILRGPDDWDKWDKQFRAKAVAYSLWKNIDPEDPNPKAFLIEPEEPRPRDYAARESTAASTSTSTATAGESSSQGRRARQQRASSAAATPAATTIA